MTTIAVHQNARLASDFAAGVPWPETTGYGHGQEVLIDGVPLTELAAQYGTPVQVVSETAIRGRARAYRQALPDAGVAYAAKAFLCSDMARWMMADGLLLDVCSAGEIALARAAGYPVERMIFHGNAKTPRELADAHRMGIGRVVVDSRHEISQIAALGNSGDGHPRQKVLLRVLPGVNAHTHRSMDTSREDQQFGFSITSGAALEAVQRVLAHPEIHLAGLHCHIGSQVADVSAYREAARRMVQLLSTVRDVTGVILDELDLGGGHAVAYQAGDPDLDLHTLASVLRSTVENESRNHRLPTPRLIIEPGRAIVARAGVTLYRVITVKRSAAGAVIVAVDGGMSDNPRPSLYGSQYTVRLIGRATHQPDVDTMVVGRHCEAGDVMARHADLAGDVRPGDLLAMLCTGAYQHSMSSNYNMVYRAPVISVSEGRHRVLIRRETDADLMRTDNGLLED